MILNRMEKRNNNVDVGDSLVLEFLNIWSDLKKFNSQGKLPNDDTRYETMTKARFNRQIDPRDDQQNLFAEYNGTYMVKRGKKEVNVCKKQTNSTNNTSMYAWHLDLFVYGPLGGLVSFGVSLL